MSRGSPDADAVDRRVTSRYFRRSRNNIQFPSSRIPIIIIIIIVVVIVISRQTESRSVLQHATFRSSQSSLLLPLLSSSSFSSSSSSSSSSSFFFFFYEYKRVRALVSSTIISIMRLMVKCKSFNKCNIVRSSQKSVRNRECTDLLRGSRPFLRDDRRVSLKIPSSGKSASGRARPCDRQTVSQSVRAERISWVYTLCCLTGSAGEGAERDRDLAPPRVKFHERRQGIESTHGRRI